MSWAQTLISSPPRIVAEGQELESESQGLIIAPRVNKISLTSLYNCAPGSQLLELFGTWIRIGSVAGIGTTEKSSFTRLKGKAMS